jgi:IMP dehydrogenase
MKIKKALTYDDVLLVPQYSDIKSRKEIYIGNVLDEHHWFGMPIISSPMDTVTETDIAHSMCRYGGLGIIHRYNTIEEQALLVYETYNSLLYSAKRPYVGAAVGVTGDYLERASTLCENGAEIICIDVAHGHHALVKNAIETLKTELDSKVHIMAGNIATLEGFNALADWGADSVRCNIGGGSICSTRIQTGHGLPGLQTILDCARTDRDVKIIADGGIRSSGDIVKALAAGADFVMIGSLLAGTDETPGEKIVTSAGTMKKYRGMASTDAQIEWRGKTSSEEGISTYVEYKGPADEILKSLCNGIKSGLSYSGARTIQQFQTKARFVRQTPAGLSESKTHILYK